jgi:hypothetical protein
VQVLGIRFRNVFLTYLREAFEDGRLKFHGPKPVPADAPIKPI